MLDPVAAAMTAAQEAVAEGALGRARDLLRDALAGAPDEPGVRLWLARVLNDLGRSEEALDVLGPALQATPGSAWLWCERGRAALALDRFAEARTAFETALAAYPSLAAARLQLADVLLRMQDAPAALEALAPVLERYPALPAALLRRAEALEQLGRPDEAEAELRGAAEQPSARLALCRLLAGQGRNREAWEVGEPLVFLEHGPEARTLLAQVARRSGHALVALELLGAVLLEAPDHEGALAEVVELLEDAPDVSAAILARRLEAHPDDVEAWAERLEGELRAGRLAAFFASEHEVPAALRDAPALVLLRGQALRRADRGAEARALLTPLCAAGDGRACYELGLLDYADGRCEQAADAFARGAEGAWAADAHFNRGVCLDRLGRYAQAAEAYGAAAEARPAFAEAWFQLGNDCRLRLGDAERARAAYRRYLDLGGDDAEARRFVGAGR